MSEATTIDDVETARLVALHRYNILDTPPDGSFDRITRLAAELLDVPVAIVSLVDHDRIWFKSHLGTPATEIDREPGLCASAIMGRGFYEVTDAAVDPRTLANPLVAGAMGVRFYFAHPLTTPDGYNLGTLCVLDTSPREITNRDRHILGTLAETVMDQMNLRLSARRINDLSMSLQRSHDELEYQAQHDALTGMWNRSMICTFLGKSLDRSRRSRRPVSVVMIDIDNFKTINDTYGHDAGDEVLKATAARFDRFGRDSDAFGRMGGEEFLAVLDETTAEEAMVMAERFRALIADSPVTIETADGPVELRVTASFGVFSNEDDLGAEAKELLKRADEAMYSAKHQGRNRVVRYS